MSSLLRAGSIALISASVAAPAAAASLTVQLSGHVETRCSAQLSLADAAARAKSGFVQTACNTGYALTLFYPGELGAVRVDYKGRAMLAENGVAALDDHAPPNVETVPIALTFLDADAPAAGLSIALTPQGL